MQSSDLSPSWDDVIWDYYRACVLRWVTVLWQITYCFHPSVDPSTVQIDDLVYQIFAGLKRSLKKRYIQYMLNSFKYCTTPFWILHAFTWGNNISIYFLSGLGCSLKLLTCSLKEIHYPLCPEMLIPFEQGIWLLMWQWQWKNFTLRVVGEDEKVHTGGTSSRAKDGDSLWVSSKVANVFIEPAQGLELVQQAIVPLSRLVPCAQKPCRVN